MGTKWKQSWVLTIDFKVDGIEYLLMDEFSVTEYSAPAFNFLIVIVLFYMLADLQGSILSNVRP